ncbi:MAG: T9SS type A sorting domain-containing protein, partial [Candidatus Desantisbacteria bacterium]
VTATLIPILPIVTILNPKNGAIFTVAAQTVTGTVSDTTLSTGTLTLNGIEYPINIAGGTFAKAITLSPGTNRCTISVAGIADYIGSAAIIVELVSQKEIVPPGQLKEIGLPDMTRIEIIDNPFTNATATVIINNYPKKANFAVADQNLPAGVDIAELAEAVREFKLFEEDNANVGTITGIFKITIPYPDTIPDDKAKDLRIFWMNPAADRWELVGGTVDIVNHTVTVEVDHLSIFRIVFMTSIPNPNNILVYPNPYYSGKQCGSIFFDQLTEHSTIRIFNIAGELVKELKVTSSHQEWQVESSIASGIYIYLITDIQGYKTTGKIGIIK